MRSAILALGVLSVLTEAQTLYDNTQSKEKQIEERKQKYIKLLAANTAKKCAISKYEEHVKKCSQKPSELTKRVCEKNH